LPDLPTQNIGFVAYYNVIDQTTVGSIDVSEVTNDPSVNAVDAYDNGVDITSYTLINGRDANARVKSDGWMIAWIDRSNSFGTRENDPDNVRGYNDLSAGWKDDGELDIGIKNSLDQAIESMKNQFSNSGQIDQDFDIDDIGLYNYEYENATATTQVAGFTTIGSGGQGSADSHSYIIGSKTTALFGNCSGYSDDNDTGISSGGTNVTLEGINISDPGGLGGGTEWGCIDIVDRGFDSPNTSYQCSYSPRRSSIGIGSNIIIWS
jgi:hypothetical protein